MIKSNQKILNMTLILLDGLICAATMIGAYLLRFANYSGAHLGLGIYLRLARRRVRLTDGKIVSDERGKEAAAV